MKIREEEEFALVETNSRSPVSTDYYNDSAWNSFLEFFHTPTGQVGGWGGGGGPDRQADRQTDRESKEEEGSRLHSPLPSPFSRPLLSNDKGRDERIR